MINYNLKLFSYKKLFDHLVELDLKDKLPPRIMLTGHEGIGKSSFALHFINYLFSKKEVGKYNINENKINSDNISFNLVNSQSHPNFYYISKNNEKKNIDIDQIRNLINFLNKSSFDNDKKIILIDGVEDLNLNSSNALLKSLEESNVQNLFILTYNINKNVLDTIKSRCLTYKLNFNYSEIKNIISETFDEDLYIKLNDDFKSTLVSPKFLINHINFIFDNIGTVDLNQFDIKKTLQFIIKNKSYKKNDFIINNFQCYIEIYFTKLYSKTKDYKYYDYFIKTISENSLIDKFNLDLESFFIKFEDKYLNI
tara:strand:- start:2532 stop:3464 length:933 start_codon:yes stop_codon:yes gene_type:complete